eukprot:15219728-Alexandrium_andersonii.AAC.1
MAASCWGQFRAMAPGRRRGGRRAQASHKRHRAAREGGGPRSALSQEHVLPHALCLRTATPHRRQ